MVLSAAALRLAAPSAAACLAAVLRPLDAVGAGWAVGEVAFLVAADAAFLAGACVWMCEMVTMMCFLCLVVAGVCQWRGDHVDQQKQRVVNR